jgi:hypothetical protein
MKKEIRKNGSFVHFKRYFPLNITYTSKIKENKTKLRIRKIVKH